MIQRCIINISTRATLNTCRIEQYEVQFYYPSSIYSNTVGHVIWYVMSHDDKTIDRKFDLQNRSQLDTEAYIWSDCRELTNTQISKKT